MFNKPHFGIYDSIYYNKYLLYSQIKLDCDTQTSKSSVLFELNHEELSLK
jgi:hypothetical protein